MNQKDLGKRFPKTPFERTSFDNNSTYNYVSILQGAYRVNSLFGDNPDEDDYLDHAIECLRQIGNLHVDLYGFTGTTDENGELCLPTKATEIEFVTTGIDDWISYSNVNQLSQFYPVGGFIAYKFLGDKIVIDIPNLSISVGYRAIKFGEDGLPLITEKEVEACAHWWKWIDTRRKTYQGNQVAASILPIVQRDKNKAVLQARIPERFSQNLMDQLGNIVHSRDRKVFNRSFKPIKLA